MNIATSVSAISIPSEKSKHIAQLSSWCSTEGEILGYMHHSSGRKEQEFANYLRASMCVSPEMNVPSFLLILSIRMMLTFGDRTSETYNWAVVAHPSEQ